MFLSTEYINGAPKEASSFLKCLNSHQYNEFIDLVKSYFVVEVLYNAVL